MSVPLQLVSQVCALCRQTEHKAVKRFADGVVVGRCVACGLLYTPVRHPEPEGVLGGSDLNDLKVLNRPIVNGSRQHYRRRNFDEYLDHIGRYAGGRRLLDIGCGQGFFLIAARERGYEVTGVEPSGPCARFAREVLNLTIVEGRLGDVNLGQKEWDVVTFTDSLEYLPDPVEALRKVVAHLAPHGIVFVKVPNGNYFLLRHVVEHHLGRWFGADEAFGPSRRVAHYTVETLNKLAQSVGLKRLAGGACRPIESPPWFRWSGLWLEMEPPMLAWWPHRLVRRALHTAGRLEAALFRARNHLSQALFVVAARAE